jgi:hypothetical protein
MTLNTRRATPERTLLLFVAFVLLAAVSAVKDCRQRTQFEQTVPVTTDQTGPPPG